MLRPTVFLSMRIDPPMPGVFWPRILFQSASEERFHVQRRHNDVAIDHLPGQVHRAFLSSDVRGARRQAQDISGGNQRDDGWF
jgi:hypothetical protein